MRTVHTATDAGTAWSGCHLGFLKILASPHGARPISCVSMAIPDFQTIMRPVLAIVADGQDHTAKEIREQLAVDFSLTQVELDAMLPSGRARMFANRVGWAITYLYQTKLLERPRRSVYRITPRGKEV